MDYRLEQWINGPAGQHPFLDGLMRHAAGWGEGVFIAVLALWFVLGWARGLPGDRQGAIAAGAAALGALLANQVVIRLWQRPRPFVAHPHDVHVLLAHAADPSFPSDHSAPAVAIAVVLLGLHRRLGLLVLVGAAVMSYARVYCGNHYPGDVLGGAAIGAGVAAALLAWLGRPLAAARRLVDRGITWLGLPLPARAPE